MITNNRWQPWYPSTQAFLLACKEGQDPLHIRYIEKYSSSISFVNFQLREAVYMKYVSQILEKLPKWREERLPPPRVNQSEVLICSLFLREAEINWSCSMTKLG